MVIAMRIYLQYCNTILFVYAVDKQALLGKYIDKSNDESNPKSNDKSSDRSN